MSQPQKPLSVDVSDGWPLVKAGTTLRRKLVFLAVPTVLAVISIPVGIAQAHGNTQGRIAAAPAVHVTRSIVVKHIQAAAVVNHVHAAAPKAAVRAAAVEPDETADTTTDPAETGTDTGHTDEVAGSTTESNVDHQFEGEE